MWNTLGHFLFHQSITDFICFHDNKHTPPFEYGFHSLFFFILKDFSPSPLPPPPHAGVFPQCTCGCVHHQVNVVATCWSVAWFTSVHVKHLWHVEDALTGLLVPEILFLTDAQNSYFFKMSCSPTANEHQGRTVRKLVFLSQKKKIENVDTGSVWLVTDEFSSHLNFNFVRMDQM